MALSGSHAANLELRAQRICSRDMSSKPCSLRSWETSLICHASVSTLRTTAHERRSRKWGCHALAVSLPSSSFSFWACLAESGLNIEKNVSAVMVRD